MMPLHSTKRVFHLFFISMAFALQATAQEAPPADSAKLAEIEDRLKALEATKPPDGAAPSVAGKIWEKVTPVLQVRSRYEYRDNYNFDRNTEKSDRDNLILLRTRFGLDARPVESVRLFVQMQDSREFGSARLAPALYGPGNIPRGVSADDEGTSLHQGYARVTWQDSGLFFQAGRQEFRLGEERLVGSLEWSNRSRSFDGGILGYRNKELLVEGFWFVVTRGNTAGPKVTASSYTAAVHPVTASGAIAEDAKFGGLHALYTTDDFGQIDAYYLNVVDRDGGAIRTAPPSIAKDNDLVLNTLGLHLWKKPDRGGPDWSIEGAYQWGDDGYLDHEAGALHAALGFTADADLEPRLKLEYNYATGDKDATDNHSGAFRNLFPTNHNKYGYIDFMAWSNLHELHPELSCKVGNVRLEVGYHEFLAADEEGTIGAGLATLPALAGRRSRQFGRELDFTAAAKPWEPVGILFGYSFFNPGKMFKQTPNADPAAVPPLPATVRTDAAHFIYLQGTVSL